MSNILQLPKLHKGQKHIVAPKWQKFTVATCGTKFGKAVYILSSIPTPDGWRKFGDIKEGDLVFNEHGDPVEVTFATDVMYDRKCYEVVFSDGHKVVVDAEHLWTTSTHSERKNMVRNPSPKYAPKARTTEEVKETLLHYNAGKSRPNHSIPLVSAPLEFKPQQLEIKPYTFGVWLGDGAHSFPYIHNPDPEVEEGIQKDGYTTEEMAYSSNTCKKYKVVGLKEGLKTLGLNKGEKFIPEKYLVADKHQRLALLRGLMDTDGTIGKRGHCMFDNTNENIADGVAKLCASLGIKCMREGRWGKLNGVKKKWCYRVFFTTDLPVFSVQHKKERLRPLALKAKTRYITEVNEVESVPVKCIKVDNPTSLFLVGDGCIPTHNTMGYSVKMIAMAMTCEFKHRQYAWLAPTYPAAKIAMKYFQRLLPEQLYTLNKQDLSITIKHNQNVIYFKGVNKDPENTIEGEAYHHIVMDEASKMVEQAVASARTTTTQTKGRIDIISTPRGKNWFFDYWKKGQDPDQKNYISFQYPTHMNPFIDPEEIALAKEQLPERLFEQYYLAKFLDSGEIFLGLEKCIYGDLIFQDGRMSTWFAEGHEKANVVVGVDWAKREDYTVFMAMDYTEETPRVVGFKRFQFISYIHAVEMLRKFCAKFEECVQVKHDKTGVGEAIEDMLAQTDLPFIGVSLQNTVKTRYVNELMLTFEKEEILIPNWKVLIDELGAYEVDITISGNFRYSAPIGGHDDTVIALMLANAASAEYHGREINVKFLEDLVKGPQNKDLSSDETKFRDYYVHDTDDDDEF